jgi:hypothetical protein
VSKKNISASDKTDYQIMSTPEQGLRILARIIARKLICDMRSPEENSQFTVSKKLVSDWNDGSKVKTLKKENRQ